MQFILLPCCISDQARLSSSQAGFFMAVRIGIISIQQTRIPWIEAARLKWQGTDHS